jgi:SAM-dependent methyltransferase
LADYQETEVYAICQDIDQRWLDFGKAQAERAGIGNIRFEKGDAFNREMLLKVLPRPNLVVSSGFYDWITDDALIKKSFIYCAQILEKGGMMIFTNQAGHRDLELVSAAFVDFNQAPLRMKTRPAQTINEWAKEAGFQNLETAIDKWGLYSVTKGERR